MSFGSGSDFQKLPNPVSDPTFHIYSSSRNTSSKVLKWPFKTYLLFKEYRYLKLSRYIMIVKSMKLLFFIGFVNVYIHFRIWTRIRNSRVTDPGLAKVTDSYGSGSTTLLRRMIFECIIKKIKLQYYPVFRNKC
jgi:hypothetical protein